MKRASKRILVILLSVVIFGSLNVMSVSASTVQADDSTAPIKIAGSQRNFTENIMNVYVWIENCLNQPITVKGNLSVPEHFQLGLEGENEIDFNKAGNLQIWSVIDPNKVQPSDSPFQLVTYKIFFLEPAQFQLSLKWRYLNEREMNWREVEVTIHPTRSTESDYILGTGSGTGEPLRSADFGVNSVSVSGESVNSDKGTPIHFIVTFINWGTSPTGTLSVNIKIKEDSNLYLGFDQGVWAYTGHGKNTGWSLRAPRWYEDFVLGAYHLYVGPYLDDDSRGIWALNGMTRVNGTCVPEPLGYKGTRATCHSATKGDGLGKSGSWSFNVNDTGDHDIFVATIRDNYWAEMNSFSDETDFFEFAVNYPMVVRLESGEDSEESSFADWFDFTFHTKHIDTFEWDSEAIYVDSSTLRYEARHRTAEILGAGIGMGTAMCSSHLDHGSSNTLPTDETFTMRENHGFDIGFGFLGIPKIGSGGENISRGTGAAWAIDAAMAIAMVNYDLSEVPNRTIGVTIHELTHLFSGVHLNETELGYACIMAGNKSNGDHTGQGQLRMSTVTEGNLSLPYNLLQFAGAARPMTVSSQKYGQWNCHTYFMFTAPTSPVQYIDEYGSPYEYYWEYTGWYDYFSVSPERIRFNVTADSNSVNDSWYFVGYNLDFNSDYWPSGFDPSTTDIYVNFIVNMTALADSSTYRYSYVRLLSDNTITPTFYQSWYYHYSNNYEWEEVDEDSSSINDASVWLLFGIKDHTATDYHQQLLLEVNYIDLYYEYSYTS